MKAKPITIYLPDTKDVKISHYGRGNLKLGPNVFSYSRMPGDPNRGGQDAGTCPGSSDECEAICFAKRIGGPVRDIYESNSRFNDVPPIPAECKLLRLHVSGDFDSVSYIRSWIHELEIRPDVMCWAYTRSWRVPGLLSALEELRAMPNVQLFASMDLSIDEMPPEGWRIAWIEGDTRLLPHLTSAQHYLVDRDLGGGQGYVCPEETGHKPDCETCKYCFEGQQHDVVFLRH